MSTPSSDKTKWGLREERSPQEVRATPLLSASQIPDLRLAAAKMTGVARRAVQAEMTLKYCHGSARFAETLLGWSRDAVEVGLAEQRTGIRCLGAHAAWSGRKRWEEKYPEAATALRELAEAHAQQDPTFRTTLAYTRLTAKAAGEALRVRGSAEAQLPSPSTMAEVLNRMGYHLRKVLKAKPQKKIPETDAIFANGKKRPGEPGRPRGQTVEQGVSSHGQAWGVLARWANARGVQSE
jgi:Rhodopirellula transposase DDE domain